MLSHLLVFARLRDRPDRQRYRISSVLSALLLLKRTEAHEYCMITASSHDPLKVNRARVVAIAVLVWAKYAFGTGFRVF